MTIEVLGWTRHGTLAAAAYEVEAPPDGGDVARLDDFYEILDWRTGPGASWSRAETAEVFDRILAATRLP